MRKERGKKGMKLFRNEFQKLCLWVKEMHPLTAFYFGKELGHLIDDFYYGEKEEPASYISEFPDSIHPAFLTDEIKKLIGR